MLRIRTTKDYIKFIVLSLSIALTLLVLVSCGTSNKSTTNSASKNASFPSSKNQLVDNASGQQKSEAANKVSDNKTTSKESHKIIQTGEINLETIHFDETISNIQNYVNSIGGYTESSSIQGKGITNNTSSRRHGSFTFKIPQNSFSEFPTNIEGYGTIIYQRSQGEDITEQYFDTEARLKSLKLQEERVLNILKKTDKLSDVIELEKHLSEIRYQIETLTGSLKKWDNLISFSTITLEVQEVAEIAKIAPEKSNGLKSRISYSFTSSVKQLGILLQGFIVLMSAILPFLVVLLIILLAVLYVRKKYINLKSNKVNNTNKNSKNND
ncbi:DUF4349 domain-containing protein [Clostridium bovifaecis]|uniref:DUF4349 domain-containing protein n=1 Tax=Clostridium bovifaecis TaxID=2184719 RepID=A0A6I6EJ25_9CLOT|nr:DUF4349 domain-containing protein [Clostridium bovifaecis]